MACVNGFKYCTQQVADSEAVETGSRPLTARDRSAIVRKTPLFARSMEYEGGARAPTSHLEHFPEKQKRPKIVKAVNSQGAAALDSGPMLQSQMEIDILLLRDQIRDNGLLSGTVVQVCNATDGDEWFWSLTLILHMQLLLNSQVHEDH